MVPIMVAASQRHEEEQLLAELTAERRDEEFKILHGGLGAFRDAERLNQVLREEAQAQWQLLIKMDNERLVLHRPKEARSRDLLLPADYNPYRTELKGNRAAVMVAVLVGALVVGLITALLLGLGFADSTSWIIIAVAVIAVALAVVGTALMATRR
jgi:hypothetical protein